MMQNFSPSSRLSTIVLVLILTGGFIPQPSAIAQIVISKPVHVKRVEGFVCGRSGKPIPNAEVTLARQQSIAFNTRTNVSGQFAIHRASGRYTLRIRNSNYSPAAQGLTVGPDLLPLFRRNTLYVVLGPAACGDACSTIYTSKRKFDQDVRMYSANYH